jgi:two-component system response regulator NreC
MSIRIVLADDHRIMRQGLKILLEAQEGLKVIAEADNGRQAVELVGELGPDLVIMDITMPDMSGVEATRTITGSHPGVKIIALSMHSDKRFVTQMLAAGAKGYLLKDCALEELTGAVQTVMADGVYVSPGIADIVIQDYIKGGAAAMPSRQVPMLTPKEEEVLRLLAEGISTKFIAAKLAISIKTVETHRQHIMEKLGMYSIAELTKYAIRTGLTTLGE